MSPLEEASRDPEQNFGFIITWRNVDLDTRVTSYSIRNSLDLTLTAPTVSEFPSLPSRLSKRMTVPLPQGMVASLLPKAAVPVDDDASPFVAFKMLPIDPTRARRDTGSFIEPADELSGAKNCKQATDLIVDTIRQACVDTERAPGDDFVAEEDIVRYGLRPLWQALCLLCIYSLADAQRMTSVYAKMEYGVKRLLWLGGT